MFQPSWDVRNFLNIFCSFWLEFFPSYASFSDLCRPVASWWPPAQESAPPGGLSWPPNVGSDASSLIELLLLSIPSYYLYHGMWSPFYRKPSLTALASENLSRQTHILFTITSSAFFMIPYNRRLPIKYSENDWDNRSWIRSVLEGRKWRHGFYSQRIRELARISKFIMCVHVYMYTCEFSGEERKVSESDLGFWTWVRGKIGVSLTEAEGTSGDTMLETKLSPSGLRLR